MPIVQMVIDNLTDERTNIDLIIHKHGSVSIFLVGQLGYN